MIPLREVVVCRDEVNGAPREGANGSRQKGRYCFALARVHLDHFPARKACGSGHLTPERAEADRAAACLGRDGDAADERLTRHAVPPQDRAEGAPPCVESLIR